MTKLNAREYDSFEEIKRGMDVVFVYVTAKDRGQAASIGRALVEEGLAACVNIIDGMTSIYRWGGEVCTDSEAVLIAKTPFGRLPSLTARVKELHTYECPCVVALPVVGGSGEYLRWVLENGGAGLQD